MFHDKGGFGMLEVITGAKTGLGTRMDGKKRATPERKSENILMEIHYWSRE